MLEHCSVGQLVIGVSHTRRGDRAKVDRLFATVLGMQDRLGRLGDDLVLPGRLGRRLLRWLGHKRGCGRIGGLVAPNIVDRVGIDNGGGFGSNGLHMVATGACGFALLDQGLSLVLFLLECTTRRGIVNAINRGGVQLDAGISKGMPEHAQLLARKQNHAHHSERNDQQQDTSIASSRAKQLVQVATEEATSLLGCLAARLVVREREQECEQDQRHAGDATTHRLADVLLQNQIATADENDRQEDRKRAKGHVRAILQRGTHKRAVDPNPQQQRQKDTEQRAADAGNKARQLAWLATRLARCSLARSSFALRRSLRSSRTGFLRGRFSRSRACGHHWVYSPSWCSPSTTLRIRRGGSHTQW